MALILTGSSGSTTLDSSAGLTFSDSSNQAAASGPYVLKNRLINGGMDIWQRATTYALTTTVSYGSVDRWAFNQGTSANGVANQVASGLTGFQYALKIGRNSGATNAYYISMAQAIETVNSIPMAGQSVTISFYAKAGTNFSQASSSIGVNVISGTGTDQSAANIVAGTWTGLNNVILSSQAITTTWTRYSFTGTVPSSATQVGVQFYYLPSGTAGADDNFYITGVQLEVGSTATPFERRLYNQELANCQRYCPVVYIDSGNQNFSIGMAYSTTVGFFPFTFTVPARVAPTGLTYTGTVSNLTVYEGATTRAVSALNNNSYWINGFLIAVTHTAGAAAGTAVMLNGESTAQRIILNGCEL